MDNEKRLLDIKKRIATEQAEEARAAIIRENAMAAKVKAMARLKEEFGVTTVDEARLLLKNMEKAQDKALAKLEQDAEAL